MKCNDVKREIDLGLKSGSLELNQSCKSHIETCEGCREYYNRAVRLAGLLNNQKFEVHPGELDEITFEKISSSKQPEKKAGFFKNIIPVRWAWVPVAAAAIFIMFAVFPGKVNHDTESGTIKIHDYPPPFSINIPGGLDSTAITDIVGSGNDLELLEDVLIYNSDVDNLIESLTDEEFDMLYERLNTKSGSA